MEQPYHHKRKQLLIIGDMIVAGIPTCTHTSNIVAAASLSSLWAACAISVRLLVLTTRLVVRRHNPTTRGIRESRSS